MIKSCSGDWQSCSYARKTSSIYVGCGYEGYCEYQLPRDSRSWTIPVEEKKEGVTYVQD